MKKEQPILSICVPTRNRGARLRIMLESLLPQIALLGVGRIQVVISSNASSDETDDVINSFREQGFSIEYYKQKVNIGHANLDFVISKAIGKYILLSGDDDIYSPNFLSSVQPFLEQNREFGLLHWNRLIGDEYCSNNRIYSNVYENTITEYRTFGDFIKATLSSSNFISSFIFNTKCWIEAPTELVSEKWDGYEAWSRILFGASQLNLRCIFYYFPLVIQRVPKQKEWAKLWPYYAIFEMSSIFDVLNRIHPGILDKWLERLHDRAYYNINGMIDSVICDIDFYRAHQADMEMYLLPEEKERLRRWLNAKDPQQEQRRYDRRNRYKLIAKKIFKHLI